MKLPPHGAWQHDLCDMIPPGLAASLRSGEGILRVSSALDPKQSLPGRAMDPVLRRKGYAYVEFPAELHACGIVEKASKEEILCSAGLSLFS